MTNVLKAIQSIVSYSGGLTVQSSGNGIQNRANQMGDALEDFIKDAFADCLGQDKDSSTKARSSVFSYLGNNTNPPDAMIKGGDAIEIKKIESLGTAQLQLNSSYPKNKMYISNPKISKPCKECEEWTEKDMLYVVGQVEDNAIKNLFFVYGDLYCDLPEVYERVENVVKDGLKSLPDIELVETKELGRVNKVDHLGITDLRIRGMWLIKTPFLQFKRFLPNTNSFDFRLVALIPEDKYNTFVNCGEFEEFSHKNNVSIVDKQIEDPRNPATLISVKLITYSR